LFILFLFIVNIYNKGVDIVGIDYCCSLSQTTAEIDNLNPNLSEINNTNINENSTINEENHPMAENPLSNVENDQYASETNAHESIAEQSKGFLSGTSTLYKKMYNTGRRRFQ
jgi:hypothetical protein